MGELLEMKERGGFCFVEETDGGELLVKESLKGKVENK